MFTGLFLMLVVFLCHLISSSILFASTSGQPKGDRSASSILDFHRAMLEQHSSLGACFNEQENQAICGSCIEPASKDRPIKFFFTGKSWPDARRSCVMNGGHLAIIRSAEDELVVRNVLQRENVTRAWVGFHSYFQDHEWVSVLDEQLDSFCYVHWLNNKVPSDSISCGSYMQSGMDSWDCTNLLPYFCEYTRCPGSTSM